MANDIPIIVVSLIVFLTVYFLAKNLKVRPSKKQNVLEYGVDFTDNIVKSYIPGKEGKTVRIFGFVIFLFIIISNEIGLFFHVSNDGYSYFRSPTASAIVTMSLSTIVLAYAHYSGVKKNGFKNYLKGFIKPMPFFLPINIIDEFASFLTLSLRLFGNIYAGEVVIHLVLQLAFAFKGWLLFATIPVSIVLLLIWQAFSLFIGAVQAYIFINLATVYVDRKMNE